MLLALYQYPVSGGQAFTRESEKETAAQRRARVDAERIELGIVEVPPEPTKPPKKKAKKVPSSPREQRKRLDSDELARLTAKLEALARADATRRRRVAMLLLLL